MPIMTIGHTMLDLVSILLVGMEFAAVAFFAAYGLYRIATGRGEN